ncbi:tetraacyldisaccharide 4'-kinase [Methylotetracoccus oryzae]|uniref:tetraacyldisaccharide 4'-kinase n=1 Tax=Methylotetracoccus oryzae TaxID=1919059 RepID=UPI0011191212|nr:tetraacyldisaccharide 4'-kinase [Methylotetracoccus oryzae]
MTRQERLGRWLEHQWYRRSSVNPLLVAPSLLFCAAARLRRWAYGRGLGSVGRLPVPVIVVGNLTVGGTGKTPLTIWLVEFLLNAGYSPGIVSRGYGGQPGRTEPLRVQPDTDAAACGDEPVLIAQRTGAPVMVARDRLLAAQALLTETACDILVADDGLQHYRLGRDVEILLVDGERRFGNGWCLPGGPLREPVARARSVDFVVRRDGEVLTGEYGMTVQGGTAINLSTGRTVPLTHFVGTPVRAMAGIGYPQRFFRHLAGLGISVEPVDFPDHHAYRSEDVTFPDDKPVLMTEKDAVKCRSFSDEKLWYVPVQADVEPAFGRDLLQRLRNTPHG